MSKSFRALLALLALCMSAVAGEIPSTFFGMHILHAVNGSTGWPSDQFGAVRLWDSGVDWHEINTAQGVYDWTAFDKWMSLAQQHNVEVTYTFGRVPSWANGGKGTTVPMTNMQYWDDFVRAIATRAAGRVKYWEIWNEPNDTHFWNGDIATLVTMAQHARQIIKSIDPNAVILTPSPTWTSTSPNQWMSQYLQAGGGQYADVIAFHGYVNSSPESIDSLAANMHNVMNANGQGSKPLWDTEASWSLADSCSVSICDQDQQSAFLVRHYMLHLSRNVERFYWYAWEDTWGTLWTKDGGVQKPGIAYKTVYNWLVGATLSQQCTKDGSGTWSCGITRPNGYQGLVIWNPSTTVSYTAASQFKQYRDMYGSTVSIPSNGSVTVNYKPILLETGTQTAGQSAPTAVLSVSPQSGSAPVTVMADSSSSSDSDGSIVTRAINFGDGYVASNVTTASHSYANPGTFTVTLSVTDDDGLTTTASKSVTVNSAACTSSLSVNVASPTNNASVTSPARFVASATSGCPINAMRIYVDNNSAYTVNSATLDTTLDLSVGTHYVVVQAWDSTGAVAKTPLNVNVMPACSSSPRVSISSPAGGYSLPSPISLVAAAASGCQITKTVVTVDGAQFMNVSSGSINVPLSLSTGTHNVKVQTWDSTGATASSAVIFGAVNLNSCFISTANRTVTICYPLTSTTVPKSVRVVAGASANSGVKAMKIYVDNVPVYLVNAARIDTTLSLTAGTHYLVVQAWDNKNGVFKSGRSITVK